MEKGDILISSLLNNPTNEKVANDLLREFSKGYDLVNLKQLLSSNDESILKLSIWIASELGRGFSPLLDSGAQLLHHPLKYVRFYAIECVLSCANSQHGKYISEVFQLLNDPDSAVRWKAMIFLAQSSREQLLAGLEYLNQSSRQPDLIAAVDWLLTESKPPEKVIEYIRHRDPIFRKFGIAEVMRMRECDRGLLQTGLTSQDTDIRDFSDSILHLRFPQT